MVNKKYIPHSLILFLFCLLLFQCKNEAKNIAFFRANSIVLSDSITYYKNRLGSQTAYVKTLQLEREGLQELIIKKDKQLAALAKEFKKVNTIIKYQTTLLTDTIFIPFDKPLDSLPEFERHGKKLSAWYSLDYRINNDSLILSSFRTWTETTVITGIKQKWPFGKQIITTDITNSNPYIQTSNIMSAQITITQPWYKKWFIWLAAGFAGGILLK